MKSRFILPTLIVGIGMAVSAAPAQAKDPCQTLLCMAGVVDSGSVSKGCSSAVNDFFSIREYHHGGFKESWTSDKREDFLKSCKGADNNGDVTHRIISMYGRVKSL